MPIKLNEPSKLKILIKKRSVKQHRGGKGIRRQAQPSFVLDSTSINERLTTQADVIRTQVSNQENSPLEHNIEMQSLEREEIKARQRLTHA